MNGPYGIFRRVCGQCVKISMMEVSNYTRIILDTVGSYSVFESSSILLKVFPWLVFAYDLTLLKILRLTKLLGTRHLAPMDNIVDFLFTAVFTVLSTSMASFHYIGRVGTIIDGFQTLFSGNEINVMVFCVRAMGITWTMFQSKMTSANGSVCVISILSAIFYVCSQYIQSDHVQPSNLFLPRKIV